MGLRINQNIAAQNAYRNLSVSDSQMSKSLEKLSSGFRINRAADDAAGLSISEGLRSQIGGMKVAVRNTQDGISVAQTAEGAMNEVTSILQRMRDLAVQTANGGATDDVAKGAAQKEVEQLNAELTRIGDTTAFGKSKLLDGTFGNTKTGGAGAAVTDPTDMTALATGFTFHLTQANGVDLTSLNGGDGLLVTVGAADSSSAADIAAAMNAGLKSALQGSTVGTFQGNEVSVAATVAADGGLDRPRHGRSGRRPDRHHRRTEQQQRPVPGWCQRLREDQADDRRRQRVGPRHQHDRPHQRPGQRDHRAGQGAHRGLPSHRARHRPQPDPDPGRHVDAVAGQPGLAERALAAALTEPILVGTE